MFEQVLALSYSSWPLASVCSIDGDSGVQCGYLALCNQ